MKKKGFTLIELLAVIVILAIIALIVTPTISKIIDNTKKEAFKQSVVGILRSGEYYIAKHVLETNGLEITYPIEFTCNGESCSHDDVSLAFQGATPKGGKIIVESRKEVIAEYVTDGKYCASGTKLNLQIAKSCSDIDITGPVISGSLEGKVIHLSIIEEESGVKGYCVNATDDSSTCNWINNNNKNIDHELESAGTYYVFARDNKDNASNMLTFTADIDAFCAYEPGQTWDFAYTGGVQNFTVPCDGLYKLEVWGAQGGSGGGYGGYAVGTKAANKNTVWYIGVGGQGGSGSSNGAGYGGGYNIAGGFNGGGQGAWQNFSGQSDTNGGGGGATHVGLSNALLKNTASSNVLIVAGGGGGNSSDYSNSSGGAGGGTTGGNGWTSHGYYNGTGGTQTSGAAYGQGGSVGGSSFSSASYNAGNGGGGGWYGGTAGSFYAGGGGGSGYVGGVPSITYKGTVYSPSTTSGINSGNGKAKITLIEY